MKANLAKRVMTCALAGALVVGSSMSAMASGGSSSGGSLSGNFSSSKSKEEVVAEIVQEVSDGGVASVADIPTSSSVAGVWSSVSGVYLATNVNGAAITTPLDTIAGSYALAAGERPYVRVYNFDGKKSTAAQAVIDNAAAALGATVGPVINFELGKMSGGKFTLLPSEGAAVNVKFGIPKSFAQADKTFAIICVRPGGAVTVLQDLDTDPNTITFATTAGQGAYAIVKY